MSLVPNNDTKRLLEKTTTLYQGQLEGSPGETYLTARGITRWAQDYFRLGFVQTPEPTDRGVSGRIAIPYLTKTGVVGIKYRSIGDQEPKYKSNTGFGAKRFFNPVFLTAKHPLVYLCEGELDCITLVQLGIPAIGVPGVHNWDPRSVRALKNHRVVIPADGDDAGQGKEFAKRVSDELEDCQIINLDGHDVNSLFLSVGEEELKVVLGWKTQRTR